METGKVLTVPVFEPYLGYLIDSLPIDGAEHGTPK